MTRDLFDTRSPYKRLEHTRRQRLVMDISRGMALFIIPVLVLYILMLLDRYDMRVLLTLVLCLFMIPISLGAYELARRGNPTLGGYLLLPLIMVILAINSLLIEGLSVVVGPVYIAVVVIAGMMLGPRESYVSALVASFLWVSTQIAFAQGWVSPAPLPEPTGSISMMVIMILTIFFVAILSQLATSDLRHALDDATYDLVQANRKLEEASKLKSQFTARTSHELRTPLSAIIVFTDLTLRGAYGPLSDKMRTSMEHVLLSAKRLKALIEDILDISKIEAGEMVLVEEPFSLYRLVDVLQSTLAPSAQEKGLRFTVTLSPALPATILGDEKRLSQIAINLAHNGIKFTDKGSVDINIDRLSEDRWRIRVADTGRGIHEENFKTIFEEFRQEVRNSQESGTGLGLAITRHLVQMMGGEIRLQSEVGKGSTFDVLLPLKPAPSDEPAAPEEMVQVEPMPGTPTPQTGPTA